MDYKKTKAAPTTITRNTSELCSNTGNLYETLNIISRRADQIGGELKEELSRKLQEFASYTDNLEEVFENREQIEISKFFERLPKPVLIAIEEYENDNIYYRIPSREVSE